MQNSIILYSTNTCPYCVQAKNFLEEQGLEYTEVNVQENYQAAERLVQETGQLGVPQIQINSNWVLGFDPQAILTFARQQI
ncbi:glutaredoxin family protein [Peribacillus sp. SCS-155]|uniref:glutaredoxin family protein n=1 Tax=Peribacillus sedimenti TaxID=3115297 RepID=UPI003905D2D5